MFDNPTFDTRSSGRRRTGPDHGGASLKWLGLALLFMLLIPCEAMGSALWPNDFLHFFSVDMRPVEVTMVKGLLSGGEPGIRFMVPRAWITFADGHNPRDLDQLPDQILVHGLLMLRLSDPDGKAFSVRATEYGRAEGISLTEAVLRLRSDEYGIMLLKTRSSDSKEVWRQDRSKEHETVEKDGLPYDPRDNRYFLRVGDIELASVQCMGKPHPVWFCNYTVLINPDVWAIITFVDFRTHGGPDFAIARINRALDVMCQQSKVLCREPDATAAKVQRND
jgi:hypothetical protein